MGGADMIGISFGTHGHAAGKLFLTERIYWRGWLWTPFVRVGLRRRAIRELRETDLFPPAGVGGC